MLPEDYQGTDAGPAIGQEVAGANTTEAQDRGIPTTARVVIGSLLWNVGQPIRAALHRPFFLDTVTASRYSIAAMGFAVTALGG